MEKPRVWIDRDNNYKNREREKGKGVLYCPNFSNFRAFSFPFSSLLFEKEVFAILLANALTPRVSLHTRWKSVCTFQSVYSLNRAFLFEQSNGARKHSTKGDGSLEWKLELHSNRCDDDFEIFVRERRGKKNKRIDINLPRNDVTRVQYVG